VKQEACSGDEYRNQRFVIFTDELFGVTMEEVRLRVQRGGRREIRLYRYEDFRVVVRTLYVTARQ